MYIKQSVNSIFILTLYTHTHTSVKKTNLTTAKDIDIATISVEML